MITIHNLFILLISMTVLIIFVILYSHLTKVSSAQRTLFALGTIVQFKVFGKNAEKAIEDAITRLNELDDKLSVFKNYSEISRINANSGLEAQIVSKDTFFLLNNAVKYSELSKGTFDPTVRPLVDLWSIGKNFSSIPSKEEITERLKLVNFKDIIFNHSDNSIKLKHKNQAIDLGGIAKGYAADEVNKIFRKNKVKSALIDLGGNIYALGKKKDGTPWKIGIQNPFTQRGNFIGILNIQNKSVVTSGDYEKYFIKEGKKYHHIIDPRTGYPSESNIISATIVSDKSLDGDGLSTGVYILGLDEATKLIESLPGVDAVFITEDKKVYITSGIKENFKLTNNEFKLA